MNKTFSEWQPYEPCAFAQAVLIYMLGEIYHNNYALLAKEFEKTLEHSSFEELREWVLKK